MARTTLTFDDPDDAPNPQAVDDIMAVNDVLTVDERAAMADDGTAADFYEADDDRDDDEPIIEAAAPVPAAAAPEPPAAAPAAPIVPVQDYAALITEREGKMTALDAQFEDGEVSDSNYRAQVKALSKEIGTFEAQKAVVDAQRAAMEAADTTNWNAAVAAFKTANPDLFSEAHFAEFNRDVGNVTGSSIYAGMSFAQQLQKSAVDYAYRTGNADLAPALPGSKPKVAKAQAPQPDKPKRIRPEPPLTLARVPAAAETRLDGSRGSVLDEISNRNDPIAMETALSRMTAAEREAWASGLA